MYNCHIICVWISCCLLCKPEKRNKVEVEEVEVEGITASLLEPETVSSQLSVYEYVYIEQYYVLH